MRNQRLALSVRERLLSLLVAVAAGALPGCAEAPDASSPPSASLPDFAGGVDAEFGVEVFALIEPTLSVTSPTELQNFDVAAAGTKATADFVFTASNFTLGQVRCYLNGAFVGAASTSPYQFTNLGKGLHTVACVLASDAGAELPNATARVARQIRVIEPCKFIDECKDDNACSQHNCVDGKCTYGVVPTCCGSKYDCAVGSFCLNPNTANAQCSTCQNDADCNDNESCTTDKCDLSGLKGVCLNTKADPKCCSKATDPCSDGKACTDDKCNITTGKCENTQPPGVCCANSDCATSDPCLVGSCVDAECRYGPDGFKPDCCSSTTNPTCNDKNDCTIDGCSIQKDTWKQCLHEKDPTKPNCCNILVVDPDFYCKDDQPCTYDVCEKWECKHIQVADCCVVELDCDDNDYCTVDSCNTKTQVCSYAQVPGCCDDDPDCNDNKFCTLDGCQFDKKVCSFTKIYPTCCDTNEECDDGKFCTQKVCVNHVCAYGLNNLKPQPCCDSNVDCNDGKACTVDSCDVATHLCVFSDNGVAECCDTTEDCDDGKCETVDYCKPDHTCKNGADPTKCTQDLECDDGKSCTVDSCAIVDGCGVCKNAQLPAAVCCQADYMCEDGKPCTADTCDANNKCHNDAKAACCLDDKDALTACDDKNACTIEYCINNECRHTVPKNGCCATNADCVDGNNCTTDSCKGIVDGKGLCDFAPIAGCTSVCNTSDPNACNDNNPCTQDLCDTSGGGAVCKNNAISGCCIDKFDCNDGKPCTYDACVQGECLNYENDGGQTLCCSPANEAVDCSHLNGECTSGKCVSQTDGSLQCTAVSKDPCTINLSYCQDFSASKDLAAMGWNPYDIKGTAKTNWGVGTSNGLGPDPHARLTWTPTKVNFDTCLQSPVFQAAGADAVTLQYDREYIPNTGDVTIRILGSLDGANVNWTTALLLDTIVTSAGVGPETVDLKLPAELTGSNGLRLAFCVSGASTFNLSSYAVDNVCVVKGSAPNILKCPANQTVAMGNLQTVPVKVKDSDVNDIISFSLVKAPAFVTLSSALYFWIDESWNSTLAIQPLSLTDVGEHEVTIKVSDGFLYKTCTFKITVSYEGGVLIWQPSEVPALHATALKAALAKQGKFSQIVADLSLYPDLSKFQYVFAVLGVYPDNHVLVEGEIAGLKLYLATGGKVYLEGGDTFMFDAPTSLHPMFKIDGVLDAAANGVPGPLEGFAAYADLTVSPAKSYKWGFNQEFDFNNLNDQIQGNTAVARTKNILRNGGIEKFWVQVGHDSKVSKYRTIGSSIPYAGVQTGADIPDTMMKLILKFFDNGFTDCLKNSDCDDGNACTTDTCTVGECSSANTCLCGAQSSVDCGAALTKIVTNSGQATQAVASYSCDPGNLYEGKEIAYSFKSAASKPVTVELTNVSNPAARLFIIKATAKGCDPTGCVGTHATKVEFPAGAGEQYYIVVDVPGADQSAQFDVSVTCGTGEICTDKQDNNGNGLIDCLDKASCCGDAACQTEICDGIDNNCNGPIDEGCDDDGDGYCDAAIKLEGTPLICPKGGLDCTDDDGTVNPGASEICSNAKDDNCNGKQDEQDALKCKNYYLDLDSDAFGTGTPNCYCAPSGQYKALASGDCNDGNNAINPSVKESCLTPVDDNCDGSTNDVNATNCKNFYTDVDDDKYGTSPFKCMCVAAGTVKALEPGDCNDLSAIVNPGVAEACNNVDDDCDGLTDEGCDDDKDGYCDTDLVFDPNGSNACPKGAGDTVDSDPLINPAGKEICDCKDNNSNNVIDEGCDDDGDGYCDIDIYTVGKPAICPLGGGDCNDTDAAVNPGKAEQCSTPGDDNCNGSTNDFGAVGCSPFFFDADSDAWGTTVAKCYCVALGDYKAINPGDCKDDDAKINPAATEICDNIDNDCDKVVDEGCDDDGDGYCDSTMALVGTPLVCPSGGQDCNDADANINPSKAEVCGNGKDDNCSGGQNDVGAVGCTQFYADSDGDKYGSTTKKCLCFPEGGYGATNGADCDDADKLKNPGMVEACDGVDNDCDGVVDDGCDDDGDGYCDAALELVGTPAICPSGGGDCDDKNADVYKGKSLEVCDGADDDCNGVVDNGCDDDKDGYCDGSMTVVNPAPAICSKGTGDCDDINNDVNPGAPEVCGNGSDDNCNGSANDENALGCSNFYFDGDKDGEGINLKKCLCETAGSFTAAKGNDCDDNNDAIKPGATEVCDAKDNDCDTEVDEAGAQGCSTFYYDEDNDGYGVDLPQCLCGKTVPYSATQKGDCLDTNAKMNPGMTEICDDTDNDCDSSVDEGCNKDGDQFCDKAMTVIGTPLACSLGGGDCDDNDATSSPISPEVCDGKDNNCDTKFDEGCDDDGDKYCDANLKTIGTPSVCPSGGGDCNDGDVAVNPGKVEVCGNTVDENCSGGYNDENASNCKLFYPDLDGDNYGKGGTSFQKVIINEFRRNTSGLTGATANEYIEILVTADLSKSDVAGLFFGDSDVTGAAKGANYQLNLAALNITTLKAGTMIVVGGATVVTPDTAYSPAGGDWTLAFVADGPYVKPVGTGNLAVADVVWIDTSATGTTSIDSIKWGGALGVLAAAAKVGLLSTPADGTSGAVLFTGDLTGLGVAAKYTVNGTASPGAANGGDNTTMINYLRTISLQGESKCLCTGEGVYKTSTGGDCNDANNLIYTGAAELCDNVDNNCNGVIDEGCDKDGDGYCDAGKTTLGTPAQCPKGGGDCNDGDKLINPGATEICGNSVDENCDNSFTVNGGIGCTTFYYDADGDGYGVNVSQCLCAPDNKFTATKLGDCDDTLIAINPAAEEVCGDNIDNNCDGTQNTANAKGCIQFFADVDTDGYGAGAGQCQCQPQGTFIATLAGDCLDTDNDVNPGIAEICDNKDNNCVGGVDEKCNVDGDAYCDAKLETVGTPIVCSKGGGDCLDTNKDVNKDAVEICDNIDNNCDGKADNGCDADNDGYCSAKMVVPGPALSCPKGKGDCDDTNSQIYPGKIEACDDFDNNCSGATDEGCDADGDKYCTTNMAVIGTPLACVNGAGDCKDGDATINPGVVEACDGIDNNCAAGIDENCADNDKDGYCNGVVLVSLACPKGGGDCNDSAIAVNPGMFEDCSTPFDDNCNGKLNEIDVKNCLKWYTDGDGDGYGGGTPVCQCVQGGVYTAPAGGDCNDLDKAINPAAVEICDGVDNACKGTDVGCDDDVDGYCDMSMLVTDKALCTKTVATCGTAGSIWPPKYKGAPVNMDTRSHGGGYSPFFKEYWYPEWAGQTVYRYNEAYQFLGTFNSGQDQMMQLWGDTDGDYYTANWGYNTITKRKAKSSTLVWSYNIGTTASAVTADDKFVYAMYHGGHQVWKLDKMTGVLIETFTLNGGDGTTQYGGLAVVDGKLIIGRSTGWLYRYDLGTKNLIDSFQTATNITNMSYNGKEYCASANSSTVYCYQIYGYSCQKLCTDGLLWPPEPTGVVSMQTYSHGGGYNPKYQEYWYPQWSGGDTTVYRYNSKYQAVGQFQTGQTYIMQLWGDTDGDYYTANGGNNTITKRKALSSTLVWTYNIGMQAGGVAADANYVYGMGSDSLSVFVLNKVDGKLVKMITLSGGSATTMYGGLMVSAGYLLAGRGDRNVYRYNLATAKTEVVWPPVYRGTTVSMNTYSHGGGWSPKYKEYWYPQWAGSTVYRYNEAYQAVGSFDSGQGEMMQLAGDADGSYYTANWGQNTVTKRAGLSSTLLWSYNIGTTAGGVAADANFVYAMGNGGLQVWKLDKATGALVETFNLVGGGTGSLNGGLAVVGGEIFVGRADSNLYRYSLTTKQLLGNVGLATNIYNVAFNGRDYCMSNNSSTVWCYTLYDETAKLIDSFTVTPNIYNSAFNGLEYCVSANDASVYCYKVSGEMCKKGNDCNDLQVSVNPGTPEVCDDADNNCNTVIDEGCDDDNDNFCDKAMTTSGYPATCSAGGGDCEDTVNTVKPGALENCSTPADDNCDGSLDGLNAIGCTKFYFDNDGDGFGTTAFECRCGVNGKYAATGSGDCDDNDPAVNGGIGTAGPFAFSAVVNSTQSYNIQVGSIPAKPGARVVITKLGICGDADASTGPARFRANGASLDFTWWAGAWNPGATHQLSPTPTKSGNARGFSYLPVYYQGAIGQGVTITWDYYNSWGGRWCEDTDELGKAYKDPTSSVRTWLKYEYVSTAGAVEICDGKDNNCNGVTDEECDKDKDGYCDKDVTVTSTLACPKTVVKTTNCSVVNPVPKYKGAPITMETYSHGGGYSPVNKEYWYPSWGSPYVYRFSELYQYVGNFYTGDPYMMQLWADTEDNYYTANWHYYTINKRKGKTSQLLWSYYMGEYASAVTADANYVYAMAYYGMNVRVINKTTGQFVKTIVLNGGVDTTMYGGLAAVGGFLYVGRYNGSVYRYNITTGQLIDSFQTASNIYNMSFNGKDYCVSANSNQVYCYELYKEDCNKGDDCDDASKQTNLGAVEICDGVDNNCNALADEQCDKDGDGYCDAKLTTIGTPQPSPPLFKAQVTMETYSHGGGYHPYYKEFWYPQWAGATIYRYNTNYQYLGAFSISQPQMMQLWGDTDDSFYTANSGYQTITKLKGMGGASIVWTYNLNTTAGGVTADGAYVYAMAANGMQVHVLDKTSGKLVKQVTLIGGVDTTLYGGLAIVGGTLYVGRANAVVYRYSMATGQLIDSFTVATNIYNMAFTGTQYCISANSNQVFCYEIQSNGCPYGGGDCVDTDAAQSPGSAEICDGKDNNCNTVADEPGAAGCKTYYFDGDQDGYGVKSSQCLCGPEGTTSVLKTPATYAAAEYDCETWGGKLASIHSQIENDSLRTIATKDGVGDFWIGLSDAKVEGEWRWEDNTTLDYSNFDVNEGGGGYFVGGSLVNAPEMTTLNQWYGTANRRWDLCYKATKHGFSSSTFHSLCNNKGQSMVIAKSTGGKVFGGYSETGWANVNNYRYSSQSFLFSLTKNTKLPMPGAAGSASYQYSVYDTNSYGPTFGGGHDLYINNNMNGGYTWLGHSYQCQPGSGYGNPSCYDGFLSDNHSGWNLSDIEVYYANGTGNSTTVNAEDFTYMQLNGKWADTTSDVKKAYLCVRKGTYTATKIGDCDDKCPTCNPGNNESGCDGKDNDCNNQVDEGCNKDGDGYCDGTKLTIGAPPICPKGGNDCNDNASTINPAAPELCNNIDDNCNTIIDESASEQCLLVANATVGCSAGACIIKSCSTQHYNLNGSYSDGCECNGNDAAEPNDTCAEAVDIPGALYDNGMTTKVGGKVVDGTDQDWFKFLAVDLSDSGHGVCDRFNVRTHFLQNPGGLAFEIFRGGCPTTAGTAEPFTKVSTGGNAVCCGHTDFNWFTNFKGGSGQYSQVHSEYGECPCTTETDSWSQATGWNYGPPQGGPYCKDFNTNGICYPKGYYYTRCQDNSAWFYLRVYKASGAAACSDYKLEITNGIYGNPGTGNGKQ